MVETVNKTSSSRDVIVNEVTLVSSNGKVFDLSKIFSSITIYEDIFAHVVSGSVLLNDGVDAYSNLGIHGNEYITISFSKPDAPAGGKFLRTFRVYKCSDRQPVGNIQSYTLYFCSEEGVFSNQQTISRSFSGGSFTDYVLSVCRGLKINGAKMRGSNFEQSYGAHDVVVTRYKPFDAIDFFAKNAYNDHEATFLFFENNDGFNFMSLERLFNRDSITKLKYSTAKLTNDAETAPFALTNEVSRFKFDSSFDVMKSTSTTAYSGRLFTLDLINQTYRKSDYSLVNLHNSKITIDDYFPLNQARNRDNKALYEEFETEINFNLTNYDQKNNPYLVSKAYRTQTTNVERTLLQRKVQLNLLENTTVECDVPGNPIYSVGYVVDFEVPALTPNQQSKRLIDPYHSGKYLITAVRHMLTPKDGLRTMLRLAKNSAASPYDTNNSNEYKKAKSL